MEDNGTTWRGRLDSSKKGIEKELLRNKSPSQKRFPIWRQNFPTNFEGKHKKKKRQKTLLLGRSHREQQEREKEMVKQNITARADMIIKEVDRAA